MTPDNTVSLEQSTPLPSNVKSNFNPQEGTERASSVVGTSPTKNVTSSPVDTVSISLQLQQTLSDIKKEDIKKEDANITNSKKSAESVIAKVQVIYNQRGDLSIRYLDTASRLVYQAPSELMMQLKESLAKLETPVNTKA